MLHPEAKAAAIVAAAAESSYRFPVTGWRPDYGYLVTIKRPDGHRTFFRVDGTYADAIEVRDRERARKDDYPPWTAFWIRMRTGGDEQRRLRAKAERRAANDGGDAYVVGSRS